MHVTVRGRTVSDLEQGGDDTRSHKLFATKLAFSHTQLISGSANKAAVCIVVPFSPSRASASVVGTSCALGLYAPMLWKSQSKERSEFHITPRKHNKDLSFLLSYLSWSLVLLVHEKKAESQVRDQTPHPGAVTVSVPHPFPQGSLFILMAPGKGPQSFRLVAGHPLLVSPEEQLVSCRLGGTSRMYMVPAAAPATWPPHSRPPYLGSRPPGLSEASHLPEPCRPSPCTQDGHSPPRLTAGGCALRLLFMWAFLLKNTLNSKL